MFTSTKQKIAFFFTIIASVLLIAITVVTMVIIRTTIEGQAKKTLETAIQTVISDYSANKLESQSFSLQRRNAMSESGTADVTQGTSNIDSKALVNQQTVGKVAIDTNFQTLQQQKSVYSRVVQADGNILFTSDLFEAYNLDTKINGFTTINKGELCIHAINSKIASGDKAGTCLLYTSPSPRD